MQGADDQLAQDLELLYDLAGGESPLGGHGPEELTGPDPQRLQLTAVGAQHPREKGCEP